MMVRMMVELSRGRRILKVWEDLEYVQSWDIFREVRNKIAPFEEEGYVVYLIYQSTGEVIACSDEED